MQIQIVANLDYHGYNNLAQKPSPLWNIQQGYIETTYIPSKHQQADIFTKALGIDLFQFSLKKLAFLMYTLQLVGKCQEYF